MAAFRDLPIRRKLFLLTLLPTAAALIVVSVGYLVWDLGQRRAEIREDVLAEATVLPDSSAAALTFGDHRVARETLGVLRIRPRVRVACLYDKAGELFESYQREADTGCPAGPPARSRFAWSRYDVVAPVVSEGSRVGAFYVSRDLDDVTQQLIFGGLTTLALLVIATGIALGLSYRLQRSVSDPLLALADTARQVSETRDYSRRARPGSRDEVGTVIAAFNEMLEHIGQRADELMRAHNELQEANRLKDEFLATLSHELRTPMNAVLGWARMLRTSNADAAMLERGLEVIERNARSQARLIEDLLDVSRIVTGKLRMNVRQVDLAALIETAIEIVRPAVLAKRIVLVVELEVRPALTTGDPDRLQQVIWNLVSNAVKFTPVDGRIRVRLTGGDDYTIVIEDTGIGIDPRFLPHIFDPFRQADATATREHGGLGLGLAIARRLVEAHGGTIRAHSSGRNQGATFELHLPITPAAQSPSPAPLAPPDMAVDPDLLRDVRVLVVDDDEDARVLLEVALSRHGAKVEVTSSVDQALAAVERARPEVILCDIGMPHADGYEFMRRLRTRPAAEGGTTPVIAVTAYASSADRAATERAGFHSHVPKPFDPVAIARVVRQLVAPPTRV